MLTCYLYLITRFWHGQILIHFARVKCTLWEYVYKVVQFWAAFDRQSEHQMSFLTFTWPKNQNPFVKPFGHANWNKSCSVTASQASRLQQTLCMHGKITLWAWLSVLGGWWCRLHGCLQIISCIYIYLNII